MIGIYFSGTGNSKYCIEKFLQEYDSGAEAFSIENEELLIKIREHEDLVFSYPVQFSNLPKIVKDFVDQHHQLWKNKRVFVIATMGLFSGDGAGLLARMLHQHGAVITGGLHLKMPDSISDEKALKRSIEKNRHLVADAGKRPLKPHTKQKMELRLRRASDPFIIWQAYLDNGFTFITGQSTIQIN